jgi:hypothetical protein
MTIILLSNVNAQVTILEENFDTATLPSGWGRIDNDNNTPASDVSEYTAAWIYKEDPLNAGNGTFSSTSYFDPIDRADRWLITPSMTLGASGNFISWKGLSGDPSFPDSYKLMVSTTTSDISAFTDTLAIVLNESAEWTEYEQNLEEYANETIYIAFVNTTFDGFKLYLDSVYVREQDPLAVDLEEKMSLSFFPNPVLDEMNIQSDQGISVITLYTSLGQKAKTVKVANKKSVSISLSELPAGVYQIHARLTTGEIKRNNIVKK